MGRVYVKFHGVKKGDSGINVNLFLVPELLAGKGKRTQTVDEWVGTRIQI